jgi:hypothetical protein
MSATVAASRDCLVCQSARFEDRLRAGAVVRHQPPLCYDARLRYAPCYGSVVVVQVGGDDDVGAVASGMRPTRQDLVRIEGSVKGKRRKSKN